MTDFVTSSIGTRTTPGFSSIDFPQVSQLMNMAIVKLGVRYPEVGCVMNNRSEMLIFIMSGKIKLFALSCGLWGEHLALPGMQVCVPRNTWYYWEPLEESMMLVFHHHLGRRVIKRTTPHQSFPGRRQSEPTAACRRFVFVIAQQNTNKCVVYFSHV